MPSRSETFPPPDQLKDLKVICSTNMAGRGLDQGVGLETEPGLGGLVLNGSSSGRVTTDPTLPLTGLEVENGSFGTSCLGRPWMDCRFIDPPFSPPPLAVLKAVRTGSPMCCVWVWI